MAYKISFTSGGLFYRDAIKVAELYLACHDWDRVKQHVLAENLLQARTQSSLKRTVYELLPRMEALTETQLQLLAGGTRQEQHQILWLAVCKQYGFVREFAQEVVREKYLRLDWEISYLDFDAFYNAKAEWDETLGKITDSTRKKLRQVLFLMLTEAEIISKARVILPILFTPQVVKAIREDDQAYLGCFPISDLDLRKLA